MKKAWNTVKAVTLSSLIALAAWFGWFCDVEWAGNIASFLLWMISLFSIAIFGILAIYIGAYEDKMRVIAAQEPDIALPYRWAIWPLSLVQLGLCVASGHIVLGLAFLLAWVLGACYVSALKELRKPKPELAAGA